MMLKCDEYVLPQNTKSMHIMSNLLIALTVFPFKFGYYWPTLQREIRNSRSLFLSVKITD